MNIFGFWLKIKSLFIKKPQKKLGWSVFDFELGRRWAKTQPHPFQKCKTLWDFCNDPGDSVYTLQNLNNFIKI